MSREKTGGSLYRLQANVFISIDPPLNPPEEW